MAKIIRQLDQRKAQNYFSDEGDEPDWEDLINKHDIPDLPVSVPRGFQGKGYKN